MNKVMPILLALCILCTLSCKKNDNQETINALHKEVLNSMIQTYEIDLDSPSSVYSFKTEAGCTVRFTSNDFLHNGSKVTGKINFEIVEIFDKGDMALTGMVTQTDDEILISGGEMFIRAYQGDKDLEYKYAYSIIMPISLSGSYSEEMRVFTGGDNLVSIEAWQIAPDSSDIWGVTNSEEIYILGLQGFGWFNCDRYINDPRDKTILDIKVPTGFDHNNSVVYLAIKGESSSLCATATFPIPIGLEVHLIFISNTDDGLLYQIISTTVSDEEEYVFETGKMETATIDELTDIINMLE